MVNSSWHSELSLNAISEGLSQPNVLPSSPPSCQALLVISFCFLLLKQVSPPDIFLFCWRTSLSAFFPYSSKIQAQENRVCLLSAVYPAMRWCLVPNRWSLSVNWGFPGGSDGKESACKVRYLGLIPGLGRSPGERNGYPLQHAGLENSTDRGVWQATVHRVTKNWTQPHDFHLQVFITWMHKRYSHFIILKIA